MARIGLIMGSQSDWETMRAAANTLDALDIPYEARIVSAHRTPTGCGTMPPGRGPRLGAIIAGRAAPPHLPGMVRRRRLCR